jgi:uncharacterized protein YjbJ (UPF0337 family)
MNKDIRKGQWKLFKGKVKELWAKVTHNRVAQVTAKRDQLLGLAQITYGRSRRQAGAKAIEFIRTHS